MSNLQEIWKDIPEYEGLYLASNLGRIQSCDRLKYGGSQLGGDYLFKGRILRQSIKSGHGYPTVALWKNHKQLTKKVHRLVAAAHVPNPDKLPWVNHKDGNKLNARADNLEWTNEIENVKHAWRTGLSKRPAIEKTGSNHKLSKKILQLSLSNEHIKTWDAIADARRAGFTASEICNVIKGKRAHHKGFIWKYAM